MSQPMISIIIVNHNGEKWLDGCMESIRKQTYDNYETIIVDNKSTDESVKLIKTKYPEVRLIESGKNDGFSVSNNLGMKHANGNILAFVNPDVYFDENFLRGLWEYKENNKLGIAGPTILDFQGKSHYRGGLLSIDAYGYMGCARDTFFVEGCALMIGKEDFNRLGGFDEKYFMYSEDIDLCWRAMMFGMKVGMTDEVSLHHYGGGSLGNTSSYKYERSVHVVSYMRRYEVEKNNLRNILKNYRLINLLWTLPIFLMIGLGEGLFYVLIGNVKAAGLLLKALIWNIRNIEDTLKVRFRLQSDRVVGDREIMAKMSGIIPNKLTWLFIVGIPKFK